MRFAASVLACAVLVGSVSAQEPENLRTLREGVARGKWAGLAELCDRLSASYASTHAQLQTAAAAAAAAKAPDAAQLEARSTLANFMACYCLYSKAEVLALQHRLPEANSELEAARAYRKSDSSFANPRLQAIWGELDTVTAAFLLEKAGSLEAAVQAYLPATYEPINSAKATGRLAVIELQRNHPDKARSWAYIHADDPTSAYVLAQLAVRAKNPVVAQRHLGIALSQIQKALAGSKEYLPVFYAEGPAIAALHRKLPPLPKPPAAPAKPKPAPAPAPLPPSN